MVPGHASNSDDLRCSARRDSQMANCQDNPTSCRAPRDNRHDGRGGFAHSRVRVGWRRLGARPAGAEPGLRTPDWGGDLLGHHHGMSDRISGIGEYHRVRGHGLTGPDLGNGRQPHGPDQRRASRRYRRRPAQLCRDQCRRARHGGVGSRLLERGRRHRFRIPGSVHLRLRGGWRYHVHHEFGRTLGIPEPVLIP